MEEQLLLHRHADRGLYPSGMGCVVPLQHKAAKRRRRILKAEAERVYFVARSWMVLFPLANPGVSQWPAERKAQKARERVNILQAPSRRENRTVTGCRGGRFCLARE